jgi:mannose-6-phosphate isomerase class I
LFLLLHAIAKTKRLSTSDLIDEFNDKAIKEQKYDLIDLLLKVASADDELSKKEDLLLTKIVKKLDIDFSTYKEMKDKTLAKVGTIETSASSSEGSANEQLLGLSDDLTDKEKCKELRKLYTKWNGQTNSSNKKTKSRAKEMIQLIAELRSKYNC